LTHTDISDALVTQVERLTPITLRTGVLRVGATRDQTKVTGVVSIVILKRHAGVRVATGVDVIAVARVAIRPLSRDTLPARGVADLVKGAAIVANATTRNAGARLTLQRRLTAIQVYLTARYAFLRIGIAVGLKLGTIARRHAAAGYNTASVGALCARRTLCSVRTGRDTGTRRANLSARARFIAGAPGHTDEGRRAGL
jgi:hypothetical protein